MRFLIRLNEVRPPRIRRKNWLRQTGVVCLPVVWCSLLLGQAIASRSFYVSPDGSDTNDGSVKQPVRSISRGVELLGPGDTLWIASGVYRETVRLTRSGQPGQPIRISAVPGAKVVISGTDPFAGQWQQGNGHVYHAKWNAAPTQLFFNGQPLIAARWPSQPWAVRWNLRTWGRQAKGSRLGLVIDPDLAETGIDWSGGLAVVCLGQRGAVLRVVRGHHAGGSRFLYQAGLLSEQDMSAASRCGSSSTPEGVASNQPKALGQCAAGGNPYFLFGKLEALDCPGEWFFDRETKTLYLWPPADKMPATSQIEGRVRDYGLVARGIRHVEIRGLQFFACTFLLEDVSHFRIEDCRLLFPTHLRLAPTLDQVRELPAVVRQAAERFLGGLGIIAPTWLSGKQNVVRNCEVAFSEGPALCVVGSQNRVENCRFHDIDWRGLAAGVVGSPTGLWLDQAQYVVFRRNSLWNIGPANGVTMLGSGPFVCELNDVHDGGLILPDGALINCRASSEDAARIAVRFNWVHRSADVGIRADSLTGGATVHHNVVWNCNRVGLIVEGNHNPVYNNTCFNNARTDIVLRVNSGRPAPVSTAAKSEMLAASAAKSVVFNNMGRLEIVRRAERTPQGRHVERPAAGPSDNAVPQPLRPTVPHTAALCDSRSCLLQPDWFDFRPRPGSPLIDAGRTVEGLDEAYVGEAPDIGAYEWGGKVYWIPGAQAPAASRPIPPDGATAVPPQRDLIWLGGAGATAFRVYVGSSRHAVTVANVRSREFKAATRSNRFSLRGLHLPGTVYWRVDSLVGRRLVPGPVWMFRPNKPDVSTTKDRQ